MSGHYVSTGHISNYSIAYNGDSLVQIIENTTDHLHWLIVREGQVEQKIALSTINLLLLCKAVSIHPYFNKIENEAK